YLPPAAALCRPLPPGEDGGGVAEVADDLDRLFERLVSVLADDAPGRLAVPFPAAEVYERLVPYRSNRSTLKVATHQDYEMAVLRLLSGERGYVSLDPGEVQEALRRETADVNPDPGLFRQFPDAILSLNRRAASRRRASCAVPRVAVKWTSAGATAPAAGARRASNDRRTVGLSDGRTVNTHPIAVIGGDGIGPEVIEAAIPVLERAAAKYGFGLELERLPYSADHYLKTRETLPDHAFRHLQDDVDAIF